MVVNEPKPYLQHKVYFTKYGQYKHAGRNHNSIKDSNDEKYFVVKGHPKHGGSGEKQNKSFDNNKGNKSSGGQKSNGDFNQAGNQKQGGGNSNQGGGHQSGGGNHSGGSHQGGGKGKK